jgi:hypothetical protein
MLNRTVGRLDCACSVRGFSLVRVISLKTSELLVSPVESTVGRTVEQRSLSERNKLQPRLFSSVLQRSPGFCRLLHRVPVPVHAVSCSEFSGSVSCEQNSGSVQSCLISSRVCFQVAVFGRLETTNTILDCLMRFDSSFIRSVVIFPVRSRVLHFVRTYVCTY